MSTAFAMFLGAALVIIVASLALLAGVIVTALHQPRYDDIDEATRQYHQRRARGDSVTVMTPAEPEDVMR